MELAGALFWLLLLASFLVPQIQYSLLQQMRFQLIRRLERKRRSRVILLVHRQEQIGLFGIPFYRFINIEDSEAILRAIRSTPPDQPIDLVIHTPGGLVLAAVQIAYALREHRGKTTVIVPHYAMSGGTLIALAADEILMDPHAVLGPVDPQLQIPELGVVPAASVLRVLEQKGNEASDQMLLFGDISRKAIQQVEQVVVDLLGDRYPPEQARRIAHELATGRWTHDYPLTFREVKRLGLPVRAEIPQEVYALMELYPQAHARRPNVEFIPQPTLPSVQPPRRK